MEVVNTCVRTQLVHMFARVIAVLLYTKMDMIARKGVVNMKSWELVALFAVRIFPTHILADRAACGISSLPLDIKSS